jgi:Predicted glycosyl transferase
MEKAILAADCVVSMGGYNTMCEIVCAARPSLIIPRSTPREEQLIRARIFADKGCWNIFPGKPWKRVPCSTASKPCSQTPKPYEEALQSLPHDAFDIINTRIKSFGAHA